MLFSPLFLPNRLRAAVAEPAWIAAMLAAEAALARAEAQAGIIPADAAGSIARSCVGEEFDPEAITRDARTVGNPAEPLVRALRRHVPEEYRRYVHYGATSQDILDTAAMLVTKQALALIEPELVRLGESLACLAEEHRSTPMAGRTLLQQALPITFGLKAAGWLAGVTRALAALHRLDEDCLAAELAGAAGTLAALGDRGVAVLAEFARLLDLAEPALPWHTERSRVAQIGAALWQTAGTADKIALDIVLLAQTEVGEVTEGGAGNRGGSSTLPQKHNPVGSVLTRACAHEAASACETLMRSMAQEHERAAGAWQAEWDALSTALAGAGGAITWLRDVVGGLRVNTERMQANLDRSGGLLMAERIALLLSEHTGREQAHALIRAAGKRVQSGEGTFREVLQDNDEVSHYFSPKEIALALDPTTYLGSAGAFIDRALAAFRDESADQKATDGIDAPQ